MFFNSQSVFGNIRNRKYAIPCLRLIQATSTASSSPGSESILRSHITYFAMKYPKDCSFGGILLAIIVLLSSLMYSDGFSGDSWSYDAIDEGSCNFTPLTPATFNTSWLVIALKSNWYVPMASKMYIYMRASFENRTVTEEYLADICLHFTPATPIFRIVGLNPNKTAIISCKSDSIGHELCLVQRDDIIPEFGDYLSKVEGISVWTDNTYFILLVLCVSTESGAGSKMWVLLANKSTITDQEKAMLLRKVKQFDFNTRYATPVVEGEICKNLRNKEPVI